MLFFLNILTIRLESVAIADQIQLHGLVCLGFNYNRLYLVHFESITCAVDKL